MNKIIRYLISNHVVAIAILTSIAALIRLIPVLRADFPLNEGGMFYVMAKNISDNHYHIPLFTTYNFQQIPFAYSPLSFYLMAGLHDVFHISYMDILRFAPLIMSLCVVPIIYLFAYELSASVIFSYIVTFFYVFMPGSFQSFIEGGGITRSPGFLCALIASLYALKMFRKFSVTHLLIAIGALSLSVLFHIESVTFAVYTIISLLLVFGRNRKGLGILFMLIIGLMICTSWWWGVVLYNHGITPFIHALRSNPWNAFTLPQLMLLQYVIQPKFDILTGFYVIGVILYLIKKKWFIPVWIGVLLICASRMIPTAASVPLAFLAAYTVTEGVAPLIRSLSKKQIWMYTVSVLILISMVVSLSTIFMHRLSWFDYVSPEERAAMTWVKEHTTGESTFVVMTSVPAFGWFLDHTLEWFPALAERTSISTVQGGEWLPDFKNRLDLNRALKQCNDKSVSCIESLLSEKQIDYSHIYISTSLQTEPELNTCCSLLVYTLEHDQNYIPIYKGRGAVIFERKNRLQFKRYADREMIR